MHFIIGPQWLLVLGESKKLWLWYECWDLWGLDQTNFVDQVHRAAFHQIWSRQAFESPVDVHSYMAIICIKYILKTILPYKQKNKR